ncbi:MULTISPECIES: hypothetical protein [unclassified Nocardia]|uniref:hypothetical protein n=1 Tax=unclassified Nocardia TaxID=2637762 RepID=UPI001CE49DC5|nr:MULTISPECIES: hypothetical protein [unclassified Nocardia]
MSATRLAHHPASKRSTTPGQIARHTAIVLAGAASLTLTVVAGAYVANQMTATGGLSGAHAAPATPTPREDIVTGPVRIETVLTSERHELPPPAAPLSTEVTKPAVSQADSPVRRTGGRLGLGAAFVGAQLDPPRTGSYGVTVDTNAFTVLSEMLLPNQVRQRLGVAPDGITKVRTEIDTGRGVVLLTVSDPAIGEQSLCLTRPHGDTARTVA